MWNDFLRNKGVLHTPFALPLLLLHFVTFLAGVDVEALFLGGQILHNPLRSSLWFGFSFSFRATDFIAVEAAVATAAVF